MENNPTQNSEPLDAHGMAALAICESLLLALTDLKVLSERDARDILNDVVATHNEAGVASETPEKHEAVVAIVQRILAGTNGTPR